MALHMFTHFGLLLCAPRPGQILIYHAWEPYQFRGSRSEHAIVPSRLKPTSLTGDYKQLHWTYGHWDQIDRDTRVEVERV